jgi:hypothetical protein
MNRLWISLVFFASLLAPASLTYALSLERVAAGPRAICFAREPRPNREIAGEGGYTSGGGDFDGEAANRTLSAVTRIISNSNLYAENEKNRLTTIATQTRILVVDHELSASVAGITQKGAAFSKWVVDTTADRRVGAKKPPTSFKERIPLILLHRERWNQIDDAVKREKLMHHELCVLAGIEQTGDYHRTDRFEELRTNSRPIDDDHVEICTLSLFAKTRSASGRDVPGKPLGTGSIVMDWFGARGGRLKIGDINAKREIRALYVISSSGYLRMKLYESDHLNESEELHMLYKNESLLKEEGVVFDPYGDPLYPGVGAKNIVLDQYFITASCSRQ